jgi:lysophospholipase L1-like esterase
VDKIFAYWTTQAVLKDSARFVSIVYRGELDSQIVFLGSSKTYDNVNAAALEDFTGMTCYNLSWPQASVETLSFLFEECLLHNKKPEVIFLEADFAQLSAEHHFFLYKQFAPFCNVCQHTATRLNPSLGDQLAFWFIRCKNIEAGGLNDLLRSLIQYTQRVLGNDTFDRSHYSPAVIQYLDRNHWKDARGSCLLEPLEHGVDKERFWQENSWASYVMSSTRQEIYRQIIERAQSEGIALILFEPPFFSKLNPTTARNVTQFFEQLDQEYEHVHYWSYREDPMFCNKGSYWNDDVHMNWDGAEILSEQIAERLKTLQAKETK